jgi:Fe2+ transport system protein B
MFTLVFIKLHHLGEVSSNIDISDKPYQCRSTDYIGQTNNPPSDCIDAVAVELSEAVTRRRTDNTMIKKNRKNDDLQNVTLNHIFSVFSIILLLFLCMFIMKMKIKFNQ